MRHWHSFHFYPLEAPDTFLVRAVKPFLAQYIWPEKGARAFFIRYEDEKGLHIRLRISLDDNGVKALVAKHFAERGSWEEHEYERESERFGGESAVVLAEEYFHLSSRVVLELLSKETYTYGDAMYDAMRLHTIAAFAAGLSREKASWYFGLLAEQWLPVFFKADMEKMSREELAGELFKQFESHYQPQEARLRAHFDAVWRALESGKIGKNEPDWLRWLRGNELILKELGENMERALPSLLHLTSNRIGINNQDEVYLNYVLAKGLAV